MAVLSLPAGRLRRMCDHKHFTFETTADLAATNSIIGQPRGIRAIEFGIGIKSPGYNIYVLGESGTGRTTAIHRFLRDRTAKQSVPPDWVYVHNFAIPHQPRAIQMLPGRGNHFKEEITTLILNIKEDLPKAFNNEVYHQAVEEINQRFSQQQEALFKQLQDQAAEQQFALVNTPSGPVITPLANDKVMSQEIFDNLPLQEQQQILKRQEQLNDDLNESLFRVRQMESESRAEVKKLDRQVAAATIEHYFVAFQQSYEGQAELLLYVKEIQSDILDNLAHFLPHEGETEETETEDLRRYEVNLLVDNSQTEGAPVVVETNPTYYNLIGRLEYEIRFGLTTTHFTNIKPGSLHRANGGYLVLNVRDLLRHPDSWEALKRALRGGEIWLQSPDTFDSSQLLAKSLDPEPIPLSVKVILLGNADLYYALYEQEEDFGELFKVKADFDSIMPRDDLHELDYALFIANRCHEDGLRHFDRPAVEKVVEFGSRLAEHQDRLSTRFGDIAGLVHEASYWAGQQNRDIVTAEDVQTALNERIYRSNKLENHLQEEIAENMLLIETDGAVVGQVNGLSVIDLGDYAFGYPGRITATTYMGEDGVVNIEREVEMAGPIHNKGVLTLIGYLGYKYAQHQPLSLSASLTFEQNYGEVEGDSASGAELLALLSSLSGVPAGQQVALTGSVNQHGSIQPVGGVSEKIEGFFAICEARGLTGTQGVVIPAANVKTLMLSEKVIAAVEAGRFHVWAAKSIDDLIELVLTVPAGQPDPNGNFPEGSLHYLVQNRLLELAHNLKNFGDKEENES